jgi:6-phosphogluconolactonase
MKLAVFPSSIETSRALILRLVELMNEEQNIQHRSQWR